MKVTVLGAGAWGTALARLLQLGGHSVTLWGHDPRHLDEIRKARRNERYLPGISIPDELHFEKDLLAAIDNADCIVIAVPSKAFREIAQQLSNYDKIIVSVTKGIEYDTGLTMCGIIAQVAPHARRATLSGPTFAVEVARGVPTAIVTASADLAVAAQVQTLFNNATFRVYTSSDVLGVELGGALKTSLRSRRE